MGIWGYENFERDDALNVLDHLIDYVIESIKETFAKESKNTLYDDFGESWIMGNIDILCLLSEHYKNSPDLESEEVIKWKQDYLDTFDRTIRNYNPSDEYIKKRREVIIATFDRLHKIVKDGDKG